MDQRIDSTCALRLTEFLAVDHAKLLLYLGSTSFATIGRRYIMSGASNNRNDRWFSRNLFKFLGETSPYCKNPELAEIAQLEAAFNSAFEAVEAPILTPATFPALSLADLEKRRIDIHSSAQRLRLTTNATSIWAALQCEEMPPRPERLDRPHEILVWRQGNAPRFRILGDEEAIAFDMAKQGASIKQIADHMCVENRIESACECGEIYLRGWVEAELVSALPIKK
jgi:hypothetical protein